MIARAPPMIVTSPTVTPRDGQRVRVDGARGLVFAID